MSSLAIMQPYLFPYIGYYQLIYSADRFVLYDSVKYIKHGWVNRNRLLGANPGSFLFYRPPAPKGAGYSDYSRRAVFTHPVETKAAEKPSGKLRLVTTFFGGVSIKRAHRVM